MKLSTFFKILIGFLALAFGTIGVVIPVWPTTPFILIAIGCFSSTPKIRAKILSIRLFREYYESYVDGRGLRRKTVAFSLVFLWGSLLLSACLVQNVMVALLLLLVGTAVTIHILLIARKKNKGAATDKPQK